MEIRFGHACPTAPGLASRRLFAILAKVLMPLSAEPTATASHWLRHGEAQKRRVVTIVDLFPFMQRF
jgi:hypothetical protein